MRGKLPTDFKCSVLMKGVYSAVSKLTQNGGHQRLHDTMPTSFHASTYALSCYEGALIGAAHQLTQICCVGFNLNATFYKCRWCCKAHLYTGKVLNGPYTKVQYLVQWCKSITTLCKYDDMKWYDDMKEKNEAFLIEVFYLRQYLEILTISLK